LLFHIQLVPLHHGVDAFAYFSYQSYCSAPLYQAHEEYWRIQNSDEGALRDQENYNFVKAGKNPDDMPHKYLWQGGGCAS
jgi:hypothetical protein